jgi:hypothetical protein
VTYRELIRPPWWWWLASWAAAALLGFEVGVATSLPVGLAVLGVVGGLLTTGLLRSVLRVEVHAGELVAGPAHAPVTAFGPGRAHQPDSLRLRRGRDADPAGYLAVRPWVHTAVELPVTDADDPTPYWLITTRRPGQLLAALAAATEDPARRQPL